MMMMNDAMRQSKWIKLKKGHAECIMWWFHFENEILFRAKFVLLEFLQVPFDQQKIKYMRKWLHRFVVLLQCYGLYIRICNRSYGGVSLSCVYFERLQYSVHLKHLSWTYPMLGNVLGLPVAQLDDRDTLHSNTHKLQYLPFAQMSIHSLLHLHRLLFYFSQKYATNPYMYTFYSVEIIFEINVAIESLSDVRIR